MFIPQVINQGLNRGDKASSHGDSDGSIPHDIKVNPSEVTLNE